MKRSNNRSILVRHDGAEGSSWIEHAFTVPAGQWNPSANQDRVPALHTAHVACNCFKIVAWELAGRKRASPQFDEVLGKSSR